MEPFRNTVNPLIGLICDPPTDTRADGPADDATNDTADRGPHRTTDARTGRGPDFGSGEPAGPAARGRVGAQPGCFGLIFHRGGAATLDGILHWPDSNAVWLPTGPQGPVRFFRAGKSLSGGRCSPSLFCETVKISTAASAQARSSRSLR